MKWDKTLITLIFLLQNFGFVCGLGSVISIFRSPAPERRLRFVVIFCASEGRRLLYFSLFPLSVNIIFDSTDAWWWSSSSSFCCCCNISSSVSAAYDFFFYFVIKNIKKDIKKHMLLYLCYISNEKYR